MPENASNIPLDDEDILDLTVVAEPGKEHGAAPRPDGPPEPDDMDGDFGADLDALLDSLGADGSVSAPAKPVSPPAQPVVPPAPKAAPIADQTPVDHKVDPDEELAMPEMSDIDSLLAELGADIPAEPEPAMLAPLPEEDDLMAAAAPAPAPAAAPAPKPAPPAAAAPAPKPAPPAAAAPMPEFDAILAQAQAVEAQKAAEEALAAPGAPAPEGDLMAELLGPQAAQAAPVAPAVAKPAPTARPVADVPVAAATAAMAAPTAQAASAAMPEAVPAPEGDDDDFMGEAGEGADDDLDLNELDALLDDILATAPEMSSPAAAPSAAPEVIPVPDQAIMPPDHSAEIAALTATVQRLEEAVEVLESSQISETMMEGFIDSKVNAAMAALFEPGSMVMDRIMNEIRGRFAESEFDESLEKMAAAAAAKVIREEITALMQENG